MTRASVYGRQWNKWYNKPRITVAVVSHALKDGQAILFLKCGCQRVALNPDRIPQRAHCYSCHTPLENRRTKRPWKTIAVGESFALPTRHAREQVYLANILHHPRQFVLDKARQAVSRIA